MEILNDAYRMYEHGENLAAILYRIQREKPVAYRRIIRVIQSVAPYFSDFYFHQPKPIWCACNGRISIVL